MKHNHFQNSFLPQADIKPDRSLSKFSDAKNSTNEKNIDYKQMINNSAKIMLDDLKEFSQTSVEFFNRLQPLLSSECQTIMRISRKLNFILDDMQKKIESTKISDNERVKKLELLKSFKERFFSEFNKSNQY